MLLTKAFPDLVSSRTTSAVKTTQVNVEEGVFLRLFEARKELELVSHLTQEFGSGAVGHFAFEDAELVHEVFFGEFP